MLIGKKFCRSIILRFCYLGHPNKMCYLCGLLHHLRLLIVLDLGNLVILAKLLCGRRPQSGAPWVRKFGKLSIHPRNFGSDVGVHPYVRPYRLWRRGRGVPRQPDGGRRMPSFLGGKLPGVFGQTTFFWAGNCMTIVACEKEVSLKA